MTPSATRRRGVVGLSLIEIMIALAIGSLLILGLVQVFAASRTAYQLSEGMSRSQENARFAMEYLQRDIRMAGHYGCVNDQSHLQTPGALNAAYFGTVNGATIGRDFPVGIRGYDATGTAPGATLDLAAPTAGWVPALPAAIAALNPIAGSDVLELRFLASEGTPVNNIANPSATTTVISVNPARWAPLTSEGVANPTMFGIADCSYVDVFPATAVNSVAGTVNVDGLINRYTPQPSGQTMLYRAESLVYFLSRKPAPSNQVALFRARSNNAGTYPAANVEEMVEGIENM
ncbi:MAG: pilus assembly protein PilW, partial [Chloroflexi bacterium]|nr:pilus assembly protein PilW [Chloroflexota bacterium]